MVIAFVRAECISQRVTREQGLLLGQGREPDPLAIGDEAN